ncbi:hypothetical protein TYRP_009672 [Tyrophagus putrescentiae]|nr:hypothetical protein TYRP_009672 [Tyrophagus putrescentiae]
MHTSWRVIAFPTLCCCSRLNILIGKLFILFLLLLLFRLSRTTSGGAVALDEPSQRHRSDARLIQLLHGDPLVVAAVPPHKVHLKAKGASPLSSSSSLTGSFLTIFALKTLLFIQGDTRPEPHTTLTTAQRHSLHRSTDAIASKTHQIGGLVNDGQNAATLASMLQLVGAVIIITTTDDDHLAAHPARIFPLQTALGNGDHLRFQELSTQLAALSQLNSRVDTLLDYSKDGRLVEGASEFGIHSSQRSKSHRSRCRNRS